MFDMFCETYMRVERVYYWYIVPASMLHIWLTVLLVMSWFIETNI